MGLSTTIHIGPYLQVNGKISVKSIEKKSICENHPDDNISSKFCPKCGSEVKQVDFISSKSIRPSQFMHENSKFDGTGIFGVDELYNPEYLNDIFISNKRSSEMTTLEENDAIDLSDFNKITNGKLWFTETYSKEIKIFEDNFGKDNVKVCWGVISDYS